LPDFPNYFDECKFPGWKPSIAWDHRPFFCETTFEAASVLYDKRMRTARLKLRVIYCVVRDGIVDASPPPPNMYLKKH
jgi:hypothetical protein